MKVETPSDQLFFVTARIEAGDDEGREWVGTGFTYRADTDRGAVHLLVTNRHMLEGATWMRLLMCAQDDAGNPALGTAAKVEVRPLDLPPESFHPDATIDVAAFGFGSMIDDLAAAGRSPKFKSVKDSLFLTVPQYDDLDAVEEVTFIGYPSGLYDAANLLPVARRGTTATPPMVDYNGLPAFLVDASVFPGSSGSPVFLLDRGISMRRTGEVQLGTSRLALLGILAAVHVRQVSGDIRALPTRLDRNL
jgi:Trypsin-like peptidase domain